MRSAAAQAFELERRARCAPRCLRPDPVRPGLSAGAAAGRARRSVHRGDALRGRRFGRRSAGTRISRTSSRCRSSAAVLDPAWATLMDDLRSRRLLDSTLIVWMGEFGRTPRINPNAGRDHFPAAWTTVLAGGGIKGGPGDRRHRPRRHGGQGAAGRRSPTSWPPSAWRSGSTPRPRTSRTSAGRSASSTPRPGRSRRPSHERA